MAGSDECQLCICGGIATTHRVRFGDSIYNDTTATGANKVATVLNQHFWFQLSDESNTEDFICARCWSKVLAFHEFYKEVVAAHSIKIEIHVKPEAKQAAEVAAESEHNFSNDDNTDDSDYDIKQAAPPPIKQRRGRPSKQSTTKEPTDLIIGKHFSMKCTQCDTVDLNSLDEARTHYRTEHSTIGYLVCCDRKFFKPNAISDHCRFHENPSEHKCFTCDKIYVNASRLDTHRIAKHVSSSEPQPLSASSQAVAADNQSLRTDTDDDLVRKYISLDCDVCGCAMDTFNEARRHHSTEHGQKGYVTCCGKKFFKKFRIMQHCEWHADPKKFDCPMCGRNFKDRYRLQEHIVRLHTPTNQDQMFQCEMCDRSFRQRCQMRYHQRKDHTRDEDKKFECYHCGKRFVFLSFLRNHMDSVHNPVPSFICELCAKCFRAQSTYELHYALHHTNVSQKVQCELCGKWLKHAKTLARHMLFHRAQPETCLQCGHVAPSKRALYSHQHLVHRDPTHKCQVCGKMFKKTLTLKEHMAIHAGITDLYTCWFCPKTFRSSSNMYKHRRLVHSAEFEAHKLAKNAAP